MKGVVRCPHGCPWNYVGTGPKADRALEAHLALMHAGKRPKATA